MSSINERINDVALLHFGGNNSKMAAALSTNEANIRNYRSDKEPRIEFVNRLAEQLSLNHEWILTGNGKMYKNSTNKYSREDLKSGLKVQLVYMDLNNPIITGTIIEIIKRRSNNAPKTAFIKVDEIYINVDLDKIEFEKYGDTINFWKK